MLSLQKDFTRLVTAENNLNFNSPGRNFKKKKRQMAAVCRSHMDLISDRRSGPLEASRQILLHGTGGANMHSKRLFVFSLSFNPARLCFKYGTWKMRSLLQAEKRIWPQAEGCAFKRRNNASTFSDSQSQELHLPPQDGHAPAPGPPRGPWQGLGAVAEQAGLPLDSP